MTQPLSVMMMSLNASYSLRLQLNNAQQRANALKRWLDENTDAPANEIVCKRRSLKMALEDIIDLATQMRPL